MPMTHQPPPSRRGSMPAATLAHTSAGVGRRGSIAKYSPNVVPVPLSTASMNAVYSAAAAARANSTDGSLKQGGGSADPVKPMPSSAASLRRGSLAANGAAEAMDKPATFAHQISRVHLTFKNPVIEHEFNRELTEKALRGWQLYVGIAAAASIALSALEGVSLQAHHSMYVSVGSPLLLLAVHVAALGASLLMGETRRAAAMPWLSVAVLLAQVLGGVIVHTMILVDLGAPVQRGSLHKAGFLFVVGTTVTTLLLRVRFTHFLLAGAAAWALFMVAGAAVYPWPSVSSLVADYAFVGALTFLVLVTVAAFTYETERRARDDFYRSQFYVRNSTKLYQQLMAYRMAPVVATNLDLSSPLEKAVGILRETLADPKLDHALVTALSHILKLVQSSNPMVPEFLPSSASVALGGGTAADRASVVAANGGHTRAGTAATTAPLLDEDQEKWVQNEVMPRASQMVLPRAAPSGSETTATTATPSSMARAALANNARVKAGAALASAATATTSGFLSASSKPGSISQVNFPSASAAGSESTTATDKLRQGSGPISAAAMAPLDTARPAAATATEQQLVTATLDPVTGQVTLLRFTTGAVLDFSKLTTFFDAVLEWNWPIFDFAESTQGMPLLSLAATLFAREGLFESLRIPADKFLRCVHALERGYSSAVPYHNSTHACDVLHGCHVLSATCDRLRDAVSDLERAALYFAAVIHDHAHPGVSNVFLIATGDARAILYNDRSVLEQHHLATAFAVMHRPEFNFTADWPDQQRRAFRDLVIDLVLATDLKLQAELLTQWKTRMDCLNADVPADRTMMLKMVIKASDVANPTKDLPIYREWIDRIVAEFFAQGDEERRLGLPISPYCDSAAPNLAGSQVGFMTWVVLPLYEALHAVLPIPVPIGQLRANFEYWKAAQAAAAAAAAAPVKPQPQAIRTSASQSQADTAAATSQRGEAAIVSNGDVRSVASDTETVGAGSPIDESGTARLLLPTVADVGES
ncbi:hypothetical protein H9P43_006536 [Blastocladiella emersonii ATCC 22665]|nr:hypothetical protein H9P43_006536 [Blastocladiella emersonii ATCC 22665]